ncbi:GAF domain-containing protein [Hazenella coriacea]|uniref:GAF domain-containing protein n=1 Tax=Hazenella coriacea TaxID=1179467 RepID=A0A4R3L7N5_9BACL|nr:GAF domain-containing protein [Hazenella coriacea]TCS95045.1 GAF domain-containing protein [Hazenella coriacea]
MHHLNQVSKDTSTSYQQILTELEYLLEGETDWLANLANVASHLFHSLKQVNWAGFYLLKENELVLGPFMGKPACVRISIGKGVCGTAVSTNQTQRVDDVHLFPGHIACDATSCSEIVIPLRVNGKIIGVLDIDSPIRQRFSEEDQKALEQYVEIVLKKTNFLPLLEQSL